MVVSRGSKYLQADVRPFEHSGVQRVGTKLLLQHCSQRLAASASNRCYFVKALGVLKLYCSRRTKRRPIQHKMAKLAQMRMPLEY
eukprot:726984-Amphidinium_carterae.1